MDATSSTPGQTLVIVDVTDVNEPPIFVSSHYITSVSEGMTIGNQLFAGILAIDIDEVYCLLLLVLFSMMALFISPGLKCCFHILHCGYLWPPDLEWSSSCHYCSIFHHFSKYWCHHYQH